MVLSYGIPSKVIHPCFVSGKTKERGDRTCGSSHSGGSIEIEVCLIPKLVLITNSYTEF